MMIAKKSKKDQQEAATGNLQIKDQLPKTPHLKNLKMRQVKARVKKQEEGQLKKEARVRNLKWIN